MNCTDGQIRLRGGTTVREGRVEICISGVWGTICDTFWDSREARVVCRQLGFLSIGENAKSTLLVLEYKKYTPGRGEIFKKLAINSRGEWRQSNNYDHTIAIEMLMTDSNI